jgi:hypothetical protein
MSTSAPSQSAPPSASTPAPTLDSKLVELAVGAWKRFYLRFKPLEDKVEAARKKLAQMLVAAGVENIATKHGTLTLQRKTTTNWEALARSIVKPELLEQSIQLFTSTSEPFLRAPASWSGEAKAKR